MRAINSLIEHRIIEKSKDIQLLSKSIHSRLPSKFHNHCWLIDIKENLALIAADSADIATALRYQQHELLKQVNEEFSALLNTPLRRIKIKVIAPDYTTQPHSDQSQLQTRDLELSRQYCRQILDLLDNSSA